VQGKARQIIELNTILQGELANLQNRRLAFGNRYETAPIDSAIKDVQKQYDRTDSLWWTRDRDPVTKAKEKPKLFYGGKEVDPSTLQEVKGGATEFSADKSVQIGDKSYDGAQVNQYARKNGMTPEAALEYLKKKAGE
jgi:hypothetical protein